MPDATGIHAHPTLKLGLRPNDPTRPRVKAGSFLQATSLPAYPALNQIPALAYPMDHNDQAGDCVVAGADHALQIINTLLTGSYTNWTDEQMLKAYQSQNPGFKSWADAGGPHDQGMNIQEFLEWMVAHGLILAFGSLDLDNSDEIDAATYIDLAIMTGEDLQVAQQDQGQVWDYVAGSGDWGGHCTVWGGYGPNRELVSWGDGGYQMTDAFVQHQVTEAWFILTQAHVDHPSFRDGFDLAGFAAAVSDLTNGKVVVPVTPDPTPTPDPGPFPPTPTPTPEPVPGPSPVAGLDVAVGEWWDGVEHWSLMHHHDRDYRRIAQLNRLLAQAAGLLPSHEPEHEVE